MPPGPDQLADAGRFGWPAPPGAPGTMDTVAAVTGQRPRDERDEMRDRVLANIARLRDRWSLFAKDRADFEDAVEYVEGDPTDPEFLQKNPIETADHWASKIKVGLNLSEFLLSRVATVYSSAPRRVADVSTPAAGADLSDEAQAEAQAALEAQRDELNRWLDAHVWAFGEDGLDPTLREVDFWRLYGGVVACEPRYVAEGGYNSTDGVELLFHRRHEFEVLPETADPRLARAVILQAGYATNTVNQTQTDGAADSLRVWHYYDGECFCRMTGWAIDETQGSADDPRWFKGIFRHGLGYLPVILTQERVDQANIYSRGVWRSLFPLSKAFNKLYTELMHSVRIAAHGYPWTNGKVKEGALAPDAWLELEAGATFSVATSGGKIQECVAALQGLLNHIALVFDMAPGTLRLDAANASSGVAIIAEQNETDAVRKRRLPSFKRLEDRYNRAAQDVYRVWGAHTDDEAPSVRVLTTFRNPPTMMSRSEERDDLKYQRDNGLISRRQHALLLNPDLPETEVDRRLEEVDEERAATAPAQATTPTPAPSPFQAALEAARTRRPTTPF